MAFQLLLATGERAADLATAEAVQDTVRKALQVRIFSSSPAHPGPSSGLPVHTSAEVHELRWGNIAPVTFAPAHTSCKLVVADKRGFGAY
jgi:hypothetical protein